jgi:cytosine/adenosine deaminase-related metal-dependent hydrolase
MDDSLREFKEGYVVIDGNVISDLGSGNPARLKADEVIDATGKVVLPGLINVHHHFFQNLTRAIAGAQKSGLLPWLLSMYRVWAGIDEEAIYHASLASIGELLLTGCTTTADFFYLFPDGRKNLIDAEFQAARELGIRFHGFRGCTPVLEGNIAHDLKEKHSFDPSRLTEKEDQILDACEEAFQRHHDPKEFAMTRVGVGPTTVVYEQPSLMKNLKHLASRYGGLCQTHLHPRPDEIEKCRLLHRCSPVQFLEQLGWLDETTAIAHGTRLRPEDLDILARTHTCVTHSPSCHMRLGYPVAPVPEMVSRSITVGIAVDGGASNDTGDLLAELRIAMLVHRIEGVHPGLKPEHWLGPQDVFRMATRNGATLLNRQDIGRLEVGKAADLILIDLSRIPYAGALSDPLGALVYCGCCHVVHTSLVNGKVVVRDGRLTQASEESIASRANEVSHRLLDGCSGKN